MLKNRNAPQIRVLHNALPHIGASISFCLRGTRSNRDAIGASIKVSAGTLSQTKYLQAGSGFLSQHTKELFFGLASHEGTVQATVRWPSGVVQTFEKLPVSSRIRIEEGNSTFHSEPFSVQVDHGPSGSISSEESLPVSSETWLIQPLKAPGFKLADVDGVEHSLDQLHGNPVLLTFWATSSDESLRQLKHLQASASVLEQSPLKIIALNVDDPDRIGDARKAVVPSQRTATVLFASEEVAGIYNILYRHLFDRQRDLPIPLSLLLDGDGMIVKVYQGFADASRFVSDSGSIPKDQQTRMRRALPFPGLLVQDAFERNDFSYGVALYQHGFLDQAAAAFQQVIEAKPDSANAYYNLGTLNLRR
ncbi:MAG: ASPIC/UnbV domain-containing protein, partial [Acidobacteriales bacterium]|nr:ASPIC/UnbV domain-containing protein [Terriglobales bacterium]